MDLSASEWETLKAVFRRSRRGGGVRTGDVAAAHGIAPASATARVKRLARRGLLSHAHYRGVELTDHGRRAAVAALRRHRIVERWLADALGYGWRDADAAAVAFEHHLPDEVVARLFEALGRPQVCPHGFPIPGEAATALPPLPTLAELEPGEEGIVALSGGLDLEIIEFLAARGLEPGTAVRVVERHPFDGPTVIAVGGREVTLGQRLATSIDVRRT